MSNRLSRPSIPTLILRAGSLFWIFSIFIGPLWVGSYFDHWRWPLLICGSLAATLIIAATAFKQSPTNSRFHWPLLITAILIAVQGIWMHYNTWGVFSRDPLVSPVGLPWHIQQLDSQPFENAPGSADHSEAFDRISYIIPCLFIIYASRSLAICRPKMIHYSMLSIFLAGTLVATIGLTQRWLGISSIYGFEELSSVTNSLFFGTYRSPGIASAYLNIALACGLALLLTQTNNNPKKRPSITKLILHLTALTILFTGSMASGSKAGMALAVFTVIIWTGLNLRAIIRFYKNSNAYLPTGSTTERNILFSTILLGATAFLLTFSGSTINRWSEASEGGFSTLSTRANFNQIQIQMTQDPEWGALGFGPGSFYPLFPYYSKGDWEDSTGVVVYAHNDFLQTLVEWGWFGTSCFAILIGGGVLLMLYGIIVNKDQHRRRNVILIRGCFIAMVTTLLHATIDFPFQIESIAITFSVLLGFAWATPNLKIQTP